MYEITNLLGMYNTEREHTQLGIADFDEIWHKYSFRKNIRPVFLFICNG